MQLSKQKWIIYLLLISVLIGGGYFRFVGHNWDDKTYLHPDERFLSSVASSIHDNDLAKFNVNQICQTRYPDSQGVGSFFDSLCSNWNPKNIKGVSYVYGELPLFIVRIIAEKIAAYGNASKLVAYGAIHFVGRSVSALADCMTIFFIFLIGRRLFGNWPGLLAAMFYALSVFPIQLSHYFTTDAFTNLPVVIAFWFAVRVMDNNKWRDYVGFGIALGAAVSSRLNIMPFFSVVGLASLIYGFSRLSASVLNRRFLHFFFWLFVKLILCMVIALFTFRTFNPHAFTGGPGIEGFFNLSLSQPWLADIQSVHGLMLGASGYPPDYQWEDRIHYLFPLKNIVIWGLGLPLGLIACLAVIAAIFFVIRRYPGWVRVLLPLYFISIYFGFMGSYRVMTMRYLMPLYPFLALLAAWFMVIVINKSWKWVQAQTNGLLWYRQVIFYSSCSLLVLVLFSTCLYANMFVSIYQRQLTRVEATRWIYANFPAGLSTLLTTAEGKNVLINGTLLSKVKTTGNQTGILSLSRKPIEVRLNASADGQINYLKLFRLRGNKKMVIKTKLYDNQNKPLGQAQLAVNLSRRKITNLDDSYQIRLNKPINLKANQPVIIQISTDGPPAQVIGSSLANEGPWDDAVPFSVCSLPSTVPLTHDTPSGLSNPQCMMLNEMGNWYPHFDITMAYDDNVEKYHSILDGLSQADYYIISSNRFYATESRIPSRFPMTIKFYQALFNGELGYDLIKVVSSYPSVGNFEIADTYVPFLRQDEWLKRWGPEEAFTVYDHPVVFIFKKNKNFKRQNLEALLNPTPMMDS